MTLALAVGAFAQGAAPRDAPVRIAAKSATAISAHAYAVSNARTYETSFNDAIAVSVSPPNAKIRFRCVTPGCTFPPQTQPGDRVDASAFDVTAEHGVASIQLVIRTFAPQSVTVIAQPAGDRKAPSVPFKLTAR